ncbi:MAG TPA: BTAD domain-containing putative transcriptional regulator, partial [Anaerolineales bacterium]|nr:BTAD domain-containing putative transcriptional regulator [Anaerolineales bacterium]
QCQEDLARAVALVRGELLAGLTVDDSIEFEEWLLLEQERLHQRLLESLTVLAEGALNDRRYETAIQYARRQITLESWREIAHRQLIQALALSGQRNAALAQYEQCRTILLQELGVEPTRMTQQLAASVREGNLFAAPPPPDAGNLANNLPNPLTPFIGRETELSTILTTLTAHDGPRLLTITGQGGIGKTRLAQEVGRALLAHPPQAWALEGIWFVPLIGVTAAENVPAAIANTLDLPLPQKEGVGATIIEQLRSRRLLLILDNFETLLDSRPWLLELLQNAAGVRLIVTSRESLHLLAEKRVALHGLATPPDTVPHTQALDYDASRLFLDRAHRLFADFRLNALNWPSVAHICRLTEGLPLGIELAVTLLDAHSPAEVVAQILADADSLASDYLDIAPHQRSIHLVFEQSWARLSPIEQRILSHLTVFESNGFSQAAALHVTGAQRQHLNALVRKSLVQAQTDDWYALHPLYKTFAARKTTETTELRRAHADYFAQLLVEAMPPVFDKQKHLQLRSLLPLLPDLRAGWQARVATADAALIGALAGPLYRLLREGAQLREGRAVFEEAWNRLQTVWEKDRRTLPQQMTLAHLSAHLGFFRLFCGDVYEARPCLEFALAEFDRLGITEGRGAALAALADTLGQLGEDEARLVLWQKEWHTAEAGDDALHLNRTLGNLGEALFHMGQLEQAREVFLRTIETAPADVPDFDIAITINNLGLTEVALGDFARARVLLEQSLQIRQQYANIYRIASARRALGLLEVAEENFGAARQQFEEALRLYADSGRVDGLGPVHLGLARAAMGEGNWESAAQQIRQALTYAEQLQSVAQGLDGLWRWGGYLWRVGRYEEARAVLGYAYHHKNASGYLRRQMEAFLTSQQIVVMPDEKTADMDWTWWVRNK